MDYGSLVETADELIAEYGQSATLTHVVAGTYNPETGVTTGGSTTTTAVNVLEKQISMADRTQPGTIITEADRLFMVSSPSAPVVLDTLTVGAIPYTVQSVSPLSPGATVIYYDVRARA